MADSKDVIDVDTVFSEIGEFGRFQMLSIFLLMLPVVTAAWGSSDFIFTAGDATYRCHIPECDPTAVSEVYPDWISNAVPAGARCERYAPIRNPPNTESCPASIFDTNNVTRCDDYVHDNTDTILYDFKLHCEDWKRTLVGTLRNAGNLVVLPLTGLISDRYGRKTALLINAINSAIFGLIRSFSVSYEMFLVVIIVEAATGGGVLSTSFIMAAELLAPKWRSMAGVLVGLAFAIGQAILGILAWAYPAWPTLLRVTSIPQFAFISYIWLLTESVRWLLTKKKYSKAETVLKTAAKINGKHLSSDSIQKLIASSHSISDTPKKNSEGNPGLSLIKQVLRSRVILKRICIAPIWWVTCTLVFYGLTINSVGLAGNIYLNFILLSLVEIPGNLTAFFALNKFGRKPTMIFSFLMCGVCNFAIPFIPEDLEWLRLTNYIIGKYFISITFCGVYVFTGELFPTTTRHTLFAFSSMVGRIGSIAAPQTPLLTFIWAPLPNIIFGVFSVASGLSILLTPETNGTTLPDTIEEAESLEKLK